MIATLRATLQRLRAGGMPWWPGDGGRVLRSIVEGVRIRRAWLGAGTLAATALLVRAMYVWADAYRIALEGGASRPDVAAWAVRCGAVSVAAAAEGIALGVAGQWVCRRDRTSGILISLALLLLVVAGVSAVALGLAGR